MQHAHGADHLRVIRQRLAHAHENNVADALALRRQQSIERKDLFDNLRRRQIPFHTLDAARTEFTPHGTSNLRADASGAPWAVGNQHRLRVLAIGPSQQQLRRAVGAVLLPRYNSRRKFHPLGQRLAIGLGEVAHRLRGRDQFLIDPVVQLSYAESRPSP